MTGQIYLDSYFDAGILTAVELVNALATAQAYGRPLPATDALGDVRRAVAVDPPSVEKLTETHLPQFVALARQLRRIFEAFGNGDSDAAAERLNDMLAKHPAHPHLAKEDGSWRLHHHPADAELVSMWTSICAEALARVIGRGHEQRLGTCAAPGCERVFYDTSKNGSRRFCSATCQSRVKTAAFRKRGVPGGGA